MHCGFKMASSMRQYLLCFAQEHVEFRLAELRAITSLFGIKAELNDPDYDERNPFLLLRLPSEACANKIMARTMLGRFMIEVWGLGRSWDELHASLARCPAALMAPFAGDSCAGGSFCLRMRTLGKKVSMAEKVGLIEDLAERLDLRGTVDLKQPEHVFHVYADYGLNPASVPDQPLKVYFGRLIAEGQRQLEQLYSVKKRHFIGNTSMDATLSLLMANQAQLLAGGLTFDPFVGTGSLLVAAAHFGSRVMGGDINGNIIHGRGRTSRKGVGQFRGKDENIRANLRQYGLEHLYLDVLVADFSCPIWREQPIFDAIITDPPYGIRESTRRTAGSREPVVSEDQETQSCSPKTAYKLSDIFTDLLNFAARFLRLHGRLVYWLPVCRPEYTEDQVPRHPCLSLVDNCEQKLSTTIGRRLITMEKTRHVEDLDGELTGAVIGHSFYQEHNAIREKIFGRQVREKQLRRTAKSEPS